MFRSGFVALVGRPNVGKSSLLNALVKQKVAICSAKPQTTRHAIRGIVTTGDEQIIFVDTPGMHKPKSLLGERMNATIRRTLSEVDAIVVMLDATDKFGVGDKFVIERVFQVDTPTVCVINKADKVLPPRLLEQITNATALGNWVDVLTTSAVKQTGMGDLISTLVSLLPEGPLLYPNDEVSDQPEGVIVAEIIREKAIAATREEVPQSVAVIVEEMGPRTGSDLIDISASIFVERDSQKGILIGSGGKMLKSIGTQARSELEALLGSRIYLDLRVKVESEWRRDQRALERFGY